MEKRTTIRLNTYALSAVDRAADLWPEHADNLSELIRKIIADWSRLRDEHSGGRMARIVALEARADDHDRRIDLIERHLEATNNDTDHA